MITEIEARQLLARAAGTIEVPSREPIPLVAPQRPRWVAPLVAATAIAAAVSAGLVVIHQDDRHDRPGPVAPSPSPTADQFAGAVPPVFAYDGDSAQRMLEDRGLRVRRTMVTNRGCETPDRALRTKPGLGFPVEPGDTVRLYVTGPVVDACSPPDQLAWQVLDHANGRGPEPLTAANAGFYVNGEPTTSARAFAVLAAMTRRSANLQVRQRKAPVPCPLDRSIPEQFAGRSSYWIGIDEPTDNIFSCTPNATVYLNKSGEIENIVVEAPAFLVDPPSPTAQSTSSQGVPAIAAHFINFAKGWMQRPGFAKSVRLYNNGSLVTTLDSRSARDRSAYFLCPGSAHPAQCGLSPIQLIAGLRTSPVVSERAGCFNGAGILPHVSGQATLLLTDSGVRPCASSWVVQLDYNDSYQIVAINQFPGAS